MLSPPSYIHLLPLTRMEHFFYLMNVFGTVGRIKNFLLVMETLVIQQTCFPSTFLPISCKLPATTQTASDQLLCMCFFFSNTLFFETQILVVLWKAAICPSPLNNLAAQTSTTLSLPPSRESKQTLPNHGEKSSRRVPSCGALVKSAVAHGKNIKAAGGSCFL